jgi:hypothetical protein
VTDLILLLLLSNSMGLGARASVRVKALCYKLEIRGFESR